jgi:hypothetical protein
MVDYQAWLSVQGDQSINQTRRAQAAWRRIQRNPTEVTVRRNETDLAAQCVRIVGETSDRAEAMTIPTSTTKRYANVFGVKDHPTVSDTDLQRGDIFLFDGARYRIVSVQYRPGEVHARAEVNQ